MGKNREIGILRGIAICAVVGIHTFSMGVSNVTAGMSSWAYEIFHSLLQFAVPCFIFISSVLLSYPLKGRKLDLKKFYSKKVLRIVIPYILWTLFYLGIKVVTEQLAISELFKAENWFLWIFVGKSYTHLYYMSVILQLYLFTPILLGFVQGIQKVFKKFDFIAVVIISIALQVGIYFLNRYYIRQYFPYQATMMIWYIYIILFGIWIGFNYERFKAGLKKYAPVVWFLYAFNTIISISYTVCLHLINKNDMSIKISTAWYQCNWFTYAIFTTLMLLWVCLMVSEHNIDNKITKVIEILGDYSFGIYLMHPVITFVLRKLIHITQPFLLLIILIICYSLMMLLCIGIIKILRMNKWTSIIIGEYTLWNKKNQQLKDCNDKYQERA